MNDVWWMLMRIAVYGAAVGLVLVMGYRATKQ
jgi:hypothetical protein